MSNETPEDRFQAWLREQEPNIKPTQRDPRTGQYRRPRRRGPIGGLVAPIGLTIVLLGLILYALGVIGPEGWLLR